jgi:hypothetical protein
MSSGGVSLAGALSQLNFEVRDIGDMVIDRFFLSLDLMTQ